MGQAYGNELFCSACGVLDEPCEHLEAMAEGNPEWARRLQDVKDRKAAIRQLEEEARPTESPEEQLARLHREWLAEAERDATE